jgi:GT2 family glycosyltransferase
MFDVACVIINYNTSRFNIQCIESIIKNTDSLFNYQIVVVDNCSEWEDYKLLKDFCDASSFKELRLVRSRINTGFGAGNMFGVNFIQAQYIAFINNDTLLINDCLSILKEAIEKDSTIAIVGGQSFTQDGKEMLAFNHFASVSKQLLGSGFLEKLNKERYPDRKKEYKTPLLVNYLQGSFMFVKASDFNSIGGFDTNLFLYYEETDLCLRLEKIGKKCYLIPDAKYIHYHGESTPKSNAIKAELKISLLYVIRKHYGYFSYIFLLNIMRIKYLFSAIFKPKNRYLCKILLSGAPLSMSMKTKQSIF